MRIVKEHDERKNEIIDTAATLFNTKGYEHCSVNDILSAINIAKGTFYHYFKSKEEVLDAVIDKVTVSIADKVKVIAENRLLSPMDKLLQAFLAMRVDHHEETRLLDELHRPENIRMHQKSLVSMVTTLTPILTGIVEEGNEAGVFRCQYPKEYMQMFLNSAVTLLDEGIFEIEPTEVQKLFEALLSLLEKMLGVEEGSIVHMALKHWTF